MENHYYISYLDVSHNTENYPNDIRLRKISGYEKVLDYLKTQYNVLGEWSFKSRKWNDPLLISNDQKLNKMYRNVFSESEFRAFCIESSKNTDFIFNLYNHPNAKVSTFDKTYLVSFMNRND